MENPLGNLLDRKEQLKKELADLLSLKLRLSNDIAGRSANLRNILKQEEAGESMGDAGDLIEEAIRALSRERDKVTIRITELSEWLEEEKRDVFNNGLKN